MLLLRNIKVPFDKGYEDIKKEIEKTINQKIDSFEIYKKSIDARRGVYYVYQVLIDTEVSPKIYKKLKHNISEYKEENLEIENKNKVKSAIIVGAGAAALFSAHGENPLVCLQHGTAQLRIPVMLLHHLSHKTV